VSARAERWPSIRLIAPNGIPIRDEIVLERRGTDRPTSSM